MVRRNRSVVEATKAAFDLGLRGHPNGYQPLHASRETWDPSTENPKHLEILEK